MPIKNRSITNRYDKNNQKFIIMCSFVFLVGCSVVNPSNMTVQAQDEKIRLDPCPETPKCVSSMDKTGKRYIPPFGYTGNMASAYGRLLGIIASEPRARIVARHDTYLKVEFRSAIFRFVDDVEFLFSSNQPQIDVRSASRVGYYDFGVNRRRIEHIRRRWLDETKNGRPK